MSLNLDLTLIPEPVRSEVVKLFSQMELEARLLREQLRLALIKKYGPKSERLTDEQLQLLEQEPGVEATEVQQEAAAPPLPPRPVTPRAARPHGRTPLPASLPREIVVIPLPAAECVCGACGGDKPVIGYDEAEQLDVVPARIRVLVTRREKRACPRCPEGGVQTAPPPPRIIPKSKFSDPLIVDVIVRKYADHLPLYRQADILARDAGVEVSRHTLDDLVMSVGDLAQPLVAAMKPELFAGGYIQADETTVPVQSSAVRGRNHRAFLWQFSVPGGPVIFDFQMGRSRAGPREFLAGYAGWLQCDGYSAYDQLGENIQYAGCLAHARRGFFEAHQLAPTAPAPLALLQRFSEIYAVEAAARSHPLPSGAPLTPAQRLALRQERSAPLMQQLKGEIQAVQATATPGSRLGKACGYALNQWERLVKFLTDGRLEVDNNWCENAMRPLALGRRNWLHLGRETAGPRVAAILSLLATCERLGLNLRTYLLAVLPGLGDWPARRIGELTPLAWQAQQKGTVHPPTLPVVEDAG